MTTSDSPQPRPRSFVQWGMTNVVYLYAVCMLLLTTACGPNYGYEAPFSTDSRTDAVIAQSIYEAEHGESYPQCVSDAKLAQFIPMAPGDLGVRCDDKYGAAEACFYQYDVHGPRFAILSTLKDDKATQVHEFLHYYLQCNFSDSDGLHHDGVWHRMGEDWVIGRSGEARGG